MKNQIKMTKKRIIPLIIFCLTAMLCHAQSDDKPFTIVEQMPEYPGGIDALSKFLKDNIKYPEYAREAGIEGTVYVTFVVTKSGEISSVKMLRGIGGGCDEEAIRVVSAMNAWIPGEQKGEKVSVQYCLPIKFTLVDKPGKKKKRR